MDIWRLSPHSQSWLYECECVEIMSDPEWAILVLSVFMQCLWCHRHWSISDNVTACPRDWHVTARGARLSLRDSWGGWSCVKTSQSPLAWRGEDGCYKTVCYPAFCLDTTLPGTGFPEMQLLSPLASSLTCHSISCYSETSFVSSPDSILDLIMESSSTEFLSHLMSEQDWSKVLNAIF